MKRNHSVRYSFLNVPYSWGGETYGGKESTTKDTFSCSNKTGTPHPYRPDPGSSFGAPTSPGGYGIDCSGMVGEAAHSAGLGNGDMGASTMRVTSLAQTLAAWHYLRAGDFMASDHHVVYARDRAVILNGALTSVPTIEADYGAGMVRCRTRTSSQLIGPNPSKPLYSKRRWIAP